MAIKKENRLSNFLKDPFIQCFGLILLTFMGALAISLFAWPPFAEGPLLYILYHLILVGLTLFPVYFFNYMGPWFVSFIPPQTRVKVALFMVLLYLIVALILLLVYRFKLILPLLAAAVFLASLFFFMKRSLKLPLKRSETLLLLLSRFIFLPQLSIYLVLIVKVLTGKSF